MRRLLSALCFCVLISTAMAKELRRETHGIWLGMNKAAAFSKYSFEPMSAGMKMLFGNSGEKLGARYYWTRFSDHPSVEGVGITVFKGKVVNIVVSYLWPFSQDNWLRMRETLMQYGEPWWDTLHSYNKSGWVGWEDERTSMKLLLTYVVAYSPIMVLAIADMRYLDRLSEAASGRIDDALGD